MDLMPTLEVFLPTLLSGCLGLAPVAVNVLREDFEEFPSELLDFVLLLGKLLFS